MKKESHIQDGSTRPKTDGSVVVATHRKRRSKKHRATAAAVLVPSVPQKKARPQKAAANKRRIKLVADPARKMRWHHVLFEVSTAVIVLLVLWTGANLFLSKITLGDTLLPGRTSNRSLEQHIVNEATHYRLSIAYPDGHKKTFSLQDVGMRVDPTNTVRATRKIQRSFKQLITWWRPVTVEIQTQVDASALKSFVDKNVSIVTEPAHNAGLSIANGAVQVSAASPGKQYGLTNPNQIILSMVSLLKTTPLHLQPTALQPSVTAPALATAKAQLEATLKQRITISIGDQIVIPSAADIADWITLTPSAKTVGITVNTDNLQHYIDGLAASHNRQPRSEVELSTSGQILQAGANGVSVGNTKSAAATITQNLLRGTGTEISLPVQYTAFKTVQAPTDNKWVEVNTTTKRMYAYDQGELVHSFLISAGAPATPTVTGYFAIYAKYRSQDMFGGNADGSSYFQPAVPYVNYFYHDYAIHGNYWRPASYFGNINSSHGCVGIGVDDGAWIYSWAPVGTPVIVHT